jgi:hypothetical protein
MVDFDNLQDLVKGLLADGSVGEIAFDDIANALSSAGIDISELTPQDTDRLLALIGGEADATAPSEIAQPRFGGYYNADGTYHWTSDNTDRDPNTGAIVRRW